MQYYRAGQRQALSVLGIKTAGTDIVPYDPLAAAERLSEEGGAAAAGKKGRGAISKLWRKIPPSLRAGGIGAVALGVPAAGLGYLSAEEGTEAESALASGLTMGALGGYYSGRARGNMNKSLREMEKMWKDLRDSGKMVNTDFGFGAPQTFRDAVEAAGRAAPERKYWHTEDPSDLMRGMSEALGKKFNINLGPPKPRKREFTLGDPKFQQKVIDAYNPILKSPSFINPSAHQAMREILDPLKKGLRGEVLGQSPRVQRFIEELQRAQPDKSAKQLMAMLHPDRLQHSGMKVDPELAQKAFQEIRERGLREANPGFIQAVHELGQGAHSERSQAVEQLTEAQGDTFPRYYKLYKKYHETY